MERYHQLHGSENINISVISQFMLDACSISFTMGKHTYITQRHVVLYKLWKTCLKKVLHGFHGDISCRAWGSLHRLPPNQLKSRRWNPPPPHPYVTQVLLNGDPLRVTMTVDKAVYLTVGSREHCPSPNPNPIPWSRVQDKLLLTERQSRDHWNECL